MNMPAVCTFRLRGLPLDTTEDKLKEILAQQAGEAVNFANADITVMHERRPVNNTCTAVFGVPEPVPAYFGPLVTGSRAEVRFKLDNKILEMDTNFYGLTQLYRTTGDHVRAEYASQVILIPFDFTLHEIAQLTFQSFPMIVLSRYRD